MQTKRLLRKLILPAVLLAGSYNAQAQGAFVEYNPLYMQSLTLGPAGDYNNGMWGTAYVGFNLRSTGGNNWRIQGDGGNGGGAGIFGSIGGAMSFVTIPKNSGATQQNLTAQAVNQNIRMILTENGQLRLGLRTPTAHPDAKLSVDGKIVSHSIYATAPVNWADYVFEKNYQLMPLRELEQYVLRNKHLPEVPTTAQVAESGVDLTAMNVVLLKKVEELTLHLIEANKRIERLEAAAKK